MTRAQARQLAREAVATVLALVVAIVLSAALTDSSQAGDDACCREYEEQGYDAYEAVGDGVCAPDCSYPRD